jgi:hypothetical protein
MAATRVTKEIESVPSSGLTCLLAWRYDSKLSVSTLPGYVSCHIRLKHPGTAGSLSKG